MTDTNTKTCSAVNCDEPAKAKTFCSAHYARNYANLDMTAPLKNRGLRGCSIEDCDRNHYLKSFCSKHYRQTINKAKIT